MAAELSLSNDTLAVAAEFGDTIISYDSANGPKQGTIPEALASCKFLRDLEPATLREVLTAIVSINVDVVPLDT